MVTASGEHAENMIAQRNEDSYLEGDADSEIVPKVDPLQMDNLIFGV